MVTVQRVRNKTSTYTSVLPHTMWTSLCTITCVLAVWSGVLVGATHNSHAVLKVRVKLWRVRVVPTTIHPNSVYYIVLGLDVLASDLLYGLSTLLNGSLRVVLKTYCHNAVYIGQVDHNCLEVHQHLGLLPTTTLHTLH